MKNILLKKKLAFAMLVIMVIGISPSSFASLMIYKIKGDVTVKSKSVVKKAEKRAIVSASDLLTIPKGGAVDILDSQTHRIYSSLEPGRMSVKSLIDKAEKHASEITRNINRKVISAVAESANEKKRGYDAMGMAIHETDAIAHPPVVLPEGTSYLSYLLENVTDSDSTHQDYIALSKSACEGSEDMFNFAVFNSLHEPLYFNIIDHREGEDIQLYFPQNAIAAPKTETVATEYRYVSEGDPKIYIIVASDKDFTLEEVKRLLEADYNPDDDFYLSVLKENL